MTANFILYFSTNSSISFSACSYPHRKNILGQDSQDFQDKTKQIARSGFPARGAELRSNEEMRG